MLVLKGSTCKVIDGPGGTWKIVTTGAYGVNMAHAILRLAAGIIVAAAIVTYAPASNKFWALAALVAAIDLVPPLPCFFRRTIGGDSDRIFLGDGRFINRMDVAAVYFTSFSARRYRKAPHYSRTGAWPGGSIGDFIRPKISPFWEVSVDKKCADDDHKFHVHRLAKGLTEFDARAVANEINCRLGGPVGSPVTTSFGITDDGVLSLTQKMERLAFQGSN